MSRDSLIYKKDKRFDNSSAQGNTVRSLHQFSVGSRGRVNANVQNSPSNYVWVSPPNQLVFRT